MKNKAELIEILEDYREKVKRDDDPTNHWVRRFFRCYIDGSYLGEDHYKTNCSFLKLSKKRPQALKRFAISSFIGFLAVEFDQVSRSTIQKVITSTIPKAELATLTAELVDDSLDLIRE